MNPDERWDLRCGYNPFNKDGSPIPFTKLQQAHAYRIHLLACAIEDVPGSHGDDTIDVVAYLIETTDLCHFDPRYDWLHLREGLKGKLSTMPREELHALATKIRNLKPGDRPVKF